MNRILDIAQKDLRELLRNRMTFLFFLLMPIVFTFLFGAAFGGFSKPPEDARLPVGFIDADNSAVGARLKGLLGESTVFRLVEDEAWTEADLEAQVADEDLAGAIVIPAGYGQAALDGAPTGLIVFLDNSTGTGLAIETDLLVATSRLMDTVRTAQIVAGASGDPSNFEPALDEALSAWQTPPIRVEETSSGTSAAEQGNNGTFSHTSPGMMLQFAIAGLLTCAQVIVSERKNRCLERLMTTTVDRTQILLGHYLAIVAILLTQFFILTLFGQLVLKLDYLAEPLASLLVIVTSALCIGGLGLLIGVLAKTEEQAIMFSLLPMFVLSALGGAWVPLEATGPAFQAVGHLSPVAWAMDGFLNIVARGLGVESVLLPALALIGYAVLFFLLAAWRFRRVSE